MPSQRVILSSLFLGGSDTTVADGEAYAIVSQGGDVELTAVIICHVVVRFSVSRMAGQGGLRNGRTQIYCECTTCVLYRPRFTVSGGGKFRSKIKGGEQRVEGTRDQK